MPKVIGVKKNGKDAGRTKSTIKRLKLYTQKPLRSKDGKLLKQQPNSLFMTKEIKGPARVQPDRRWFGNTRVIGQKQLDEFRKAVGIQEKNPFRVILKRQKLPISLLEEPKGSIKMNLLSSESFEDTFGPKATRKKPKMEHRDMESFAKTTADRLKKFTESVEIESEEQNGVDKEEKRVPRESVFFKGQSKRIWNELYKVIDSSDVVLQVLDARDPEGTRCRRLEKTFLKRDCHKNLAFVLNKCDLIPSWAVERWISVLSKEFPTVAFHASAKKPFGKGTLIKLLRQYATLHSNRKQISVGFIGYPNVGKSSVINVLKKKKVCKVAPIAGETKVWQYVTLFRRIYLIDCPGVVPSNDNTDADSVLKGVVRVENIESPEQYVPEVLKRVKRKYLVRAYGEFDWNTPDEFLDKFARKSGKLLKGGEPDLNNCARIILHDWQRGKLPWFNAPERKEADEKSKIVTEE